MKKLSFKKVNIADADVLTSLQMKKIVGGHEPHDVNCRVLCNSGSDYQINGPVMSCEQAYENAANLCNNEQDGGAMEVNCNCC